VERENSPMHYTFPCREIVGQAVPPDLREHVLRIMQAHGGNARWTETNTIFTFPEGTTTVQVGLATRQPRYRIVFPDHYEVCETYLREWGNSLVAFPDREFPDGLLNKYEHNWVHQ
jgi:hypothetical protein